jgi:hypothetical protein
MKACMSPASRIFAGATLMFFTTAAMAVPQLNIDNAFVEFDDYTLTITGSLSISELGSSSGMDICFGSRR